MTINPTKLQNELAQFTGTEKYHRFSPLFRTVLLTDGAKHLAESCQCYWLMDIVGSVQTIKKVKSEPMQVFKLTTKNSKGNVVVEDGNNNVLYKQKLDFTDFPLSEITIWCMDGGDGNKIIMLPSEY